MDPNTNLESSDYDGRTPLHLASSEGHTEILKELIKQGVKDVNPTDRWGNTPLDDAKRGIFQETIDYMESVGGMAKIKKPSSRKKQSG